jgi:hypothetical protein
MPYLAPPAITSQIVGSSSQLGVGRVLVRQLRRLDRWEDALFQAEQLVQSEPLDSNALGLLALCQLRAGRPEDALKTIEKLKTSESFWALLARATLLATWDDDEKAASKLVQKALTLSPDDPDGWWLALQTSQTEGEAKKAIEKLKQLKPKGYPFDEFIGDLDSMGLSLVALNDSRKEFYRRRKQIFLPKSAIIPMIQEQGMLFVVVKIDNKPFKLLFDTGAGNALLADRAPARRLRAKFLSNTVIRGVQGKETARILRPKSVGVGPLRLGPVPLRVAADTPMCDGIFGGALLDDYAVTLDFAQSALVLKKGKKGAGTPGKGAFVLPFRQLYGGNLYVPLRISALATPDAERTFSLETSLWAIVDTGAQTGMVSRRIARTLALGLPDDAVRTVENAMPVGIGNTKSTMKLDIVPRPFSLMGPGGLSHPVTYGIGASPLDDVISTGTGFETGALLGMPFLMRYKKVTFDYPNKRLILEGAPPVPPVTIVSDEKRLSLVAPTTPAGEGKTWVFVTDAGRWTALPALPKGTPTLAPFTLPPGYRALRIDKQSWALTPVR